ncbi:hypothetical protein [Vibrio metschnikovii]|uniref:hypothetical protein n=1 Tax=Vibrio metschnikovii TaxID=28172 RepID=UPI001C2F5D91|nr:hypothetical protein [Vibrio metschnikovii]
MIQSALFALFIALVSFPDWLDLNAIQEKPLAAPTLIHQHVASEQAHPEHYSLAIVVRSEPNRTTPIRLISDDNDDIALKKDTPFYLALALSVAAIILWFYFSQSTLFFIRKALQFSNLYSRFAHA